MELGRLKSAPLCFGVGYIGGSSGTVNVCRHLVEH